MSNTLGWVGKRASVKKVLKWLKFLVVSKINYKFALPKQQR